jgi:hypothetical protein
MIIIKKNKIVFDPHSSKREKKDVGEKDLPKFLTETVKIGKGVTFKRIFDLIILHKDLFNVLFDSGCLHGHKIEMYLGEYDKEVEATKDITYLEVYWGTDYWNLSGEKELYLYPSFHGIKKNYTDENTSEPFDCPIGITSNINGLKNLPFNVNEHASFQEIKNGKLKKKLEGKCEMNLFDMIRGILFEISYYGTPENCGEFFEDMAKTVERIKSGEEDMYELKGKKKNGMPKFKKIKKKKNSEEKEDL